MRRIFLAVFIAVAVNAWWAIPAIAGCQPVVCAPANDDNGQSGDHAPSPSQKAQLPSNDGTNKAAKESPAITYFCNYQ
jgi:hypothetical protein